LRLKASGEPLFARAAGFARNYTKKFLQNPVDLTRHFDTFSPPFIRI
jgi:hypothetical protein